MRFFYIEIWYFSELKWVFVFLGYVVKEVKILGFLKVDILKDMDLDFVELNLFDDVDVLD